MSSWYDELGVRTTEDILTEMSSTLKPLTKEDILKMNIKELQTQLNEAHVKIHHLHDIINEMHSLSQRSIDNLIKSVDIGYGRWNLDKKNGQG
jgi:5-bromo-4-chloroindolyl phosphate hydrolysis protein